CVAALPRHGALGRNELEGIRQSRRGGRGFRRTELRSHAQRDARRQPPRRSARARAGVANLGRSRIRRALAVTFGTTRGFAQEENFAAGRGRSASRGNTLYGYGAMRSAFALRRSRLNLSGSKIKRTSEKRSVS